jgi:xanthine dehydrogenase molybdopterin-binding subunit B
MSAVGRNLPHDSARGHVTGESIYIDDMPPLKNELIVDFVWSHVAHGEIRSIDLEGARKLDGVAGLFTYRDLAHNIFGPIIADELLIAESEVSFIGQPIVVIAAENRDAIAAAKKAIKVEIDALEPISPSTTRRSISPSSGRFDTSTAAISRADSLRLTTFSKASSSTAARTTSISNRRPHSPSRASSTSSWSIHRRRTLQRFNT